VVHLALLSFGEMAKIAKEVRPDVAHGKGSIA
jgi:hypothetical protein